MQNGGTVVDETKEKEYQAVIDELMAENKMLLAKLKEYVPITCHTCNHENCEDCDRRLDGWQMGEIV